MTRSTSGRIRALAAVAALSALWACGPADAHTDGDSTALVGPEQAQPDPRVARADESRILGDPAATLWVLIVSDFQCPYCKQWHETVSSGFNREFVATGKVRLAYVHFPLRMHANAIPAAEASMCAGAQGKFWEYHDRLFATLDSWGGVASPGLHFGELASGLQLDTAAFASCLTDRVMLPMVQADYERGARMNVNSTPTFMVGSTMIAGAASLEALRTAVNQALAK